MVVAFPLQTDVTGGILVSGWTEPAMEITQSAV